MEPSSIQYAAYVGLDWADREHGLVFTNARPYVSGFGFRRPDSRSNRDVGGCTRTTLSRATGRSCA